VFVCGVYAFVPFLCELRRLSWAEGACQACCVCASVFEGMCLYMVYMRVCLSSVN
jgi:hypothetical protein